MLDDYEDYSDEDRGLTFDQVLDFLEEELLTVIDTDNPYRPLDFNDTDQGYEE